MKPKAILFLLTTLLLYSCNGGYYSHIPRAKTKVSYSNRQPVKPIKDTIPYHLISPEFACKLSVEVIQEVNLAYSRIDSIPPNTGKELPTDTAIRVISYNDHVKEVYISGKKTFYKYSLLSLLQPFILFFTENIFAQILFSTASFIAIIGLGLFFTSILLHLFRKRYALNSEQENYRERIKKKIDNQLFTAAICIAILILGFINPGDIINTGVMIGVFAASAAGIFYLFFSLAYKIYLYQKLKYTKIDSNIPDDPDKAPKNPRIELLITALKFLGTASLFWIPYFIATSEATGVTILLIEYTSLTPIFLMWPLGFLLLFGVFFFRRQKKRKLTND